jgi:Protein of unknown function (DUF1116)
VIAVADLISQELNVVNIGLASFGDVIREKGGKATDLQWQPPAGGNPKDAWNLALLTGDPRVAEANKVAYGRFLAAKPVLVGVKTAREALPDMDGKIILHSGPPVAWNNMCGPQQGAVLGAVLFEGWAGDLDAARRLVEAGAIRLEPCHHHRAVGPMAGITSPSMPVWIVRDTASGGEA